VRLEAEVPAEFGRARHRCGDIEGRIAGSEMEMEGRRMAIGELGGAELVFDDSI